MKWFKELLRLIHCDVCEYQQFKLELIISHILLFLLITTQKWIYILYEVQIQSFEKLRSLSIK